MIAALSHGAIRLLDTRWLLDPHCPADQLPRRQMLEVLASERGQQQPFVSPARAKELLLLEGRRIGVLSYCWLTAGHPDPIALHLSALQAFLRSKQQPDGIPFVDAVFWDFASLPQHPRTEAEQALFQQGLSVMGGLYASPMGTTVLQLRTVPPRPAEYNGHVTVYSATLRGEESTAYLGSIMSEFGEVEKVEVERAGEASVAFATHAQAERAVANANGRDPSLAVVLSYNERPYAERGWPIFEDGVSREAVVWSRVYSQQHGAASSAVLAAKLYYILTDGSCSQPPEEMEEVPDVDAMINRLAQARFTGKGDQEKVMELFRQFRVQVHAYFSSPAAS